VRVTRNLAPTLRWLATRRRHGLRRLESGDELAKTHGDRWTSFCNPLPWLPLFQCDVSAAHLG